MSTLELSLKEYEWYEEEEILNLYRSVGWSNYYENPTMLKNAYEHSLYIVGGYIEDKLVGVIRVVGDGASIMYIQDILVSPDYQRKGIGSKLFAKVMEKYEDVYQKVLITENTDKTKLFYEDLGFQAINTIDGLCFVQYTI